MTTRLLPTSTDTNAWTVVGGADPVDVLGAGVDGALDDAAYIYATASETCRVSLDPAVLDPGYDTGFVLRVRTRYSGVAAVDVDTGEDASPLIMVSLLCGAATVKAFQIHPEKLWGTTQVGLLPSEVALITNFADLHLELDGIPGAGVSLKARVSGADLGFAPPPVANVTGLGLGVEPTAETVIGTYPRVEALIGLGS